MSVYLSIFPFLGVSVPGCFLVPMSKYVHIQQNLTRYVTYEIGRDLHISVLFSINWTQNANSPGKSSHVEVSSRMKVEGAEG